MMTAVTRDELSWERMLFNARVGLVVFVLVLSFGWWGFLEIGDTLIVVNSSRFKVSRMSVDMEFLAFLW